VVLVALLLATLPFMWSEDISCDGRPKPLVSGIEILFGKHFENPALGGIFLGLLAVAVGLGFLVRRTQRPWRILAGEIVAGLSGIGTTLLCVLMTTRGRSDQPFDHPAAWIGTLSAFAMAVDAWYNAGEALCCGQEQRRARKAQVARIVAAEPGPLRIAPGLEDEDERERERELEDEEARERERELEDAMGQPPARRRPF
jgi:hypothetical protein